MIGLLLSASLLTQPPDLTKLDRRIAKEPAYQGQPRYGLLAVGPAAAFKAWFVLDGETLHVDCNGNGDLTEPAEKFAAKKHSDGVTFERITLEDGPRRHTAFRLGVGKLKNLSHVYEGDPLFKKLLAADPEAPHYTLAVYAEETLPGRPKEVRYMASGADLNDLLRLGATPAEAPVIHIGGPWRMATWDSKPTIEVGGVTDFIVGVGCPGVGPGTFAFACYEEGAIPDSATPKLTLHLTPKGKGVPSVMVHHCLTDRC